MDDRVRRGFSPDSEQGDQSVQLTKEGGEVDQEEAAGEEGVEERERQDERGNQSHGSRTKGTSTRRIRKEWRY